MTAFSVDPDRLAELLERMTACANRLVQVREDVDTRVRRAHASWRGAAADEQADAHRRWVQGAEQMHEALGDLRAVAATAHANYTAAARANTGMWTL